MAGKSKRPCIIAIHYARLYSFFVKVVSDTVSEIQGLGEKGSVTDVNHLSLPLYFLYLKLTSNTLNSFSVDAEIRPSDTGGRSGMNNSLASFLCWEIELHVINKPE